MTIVHQLIPIAAQLGKTLHLAVAQLSPSCRNRIASHSGRP